MAKKTFELSFQIGAKLAGSFSGTFKGINARLVDLRNEARQTQRALDQLNKDFRQGKITQDQYREATERLTRQLAKLEAAQKGISSVQTGFKSTLTQGFNTAKTTAKLAAVGAAASATAIAFNSLQTAADFEQQMRKVGVIAGATSEEMKMLSDTALKLGADSSLSASEVAVAMGELAAKGMDANKIVGAMPGIIAAAEASGEDLALTSEVVTSALNAFGLEAEKASHIADVMAMSANKTAAGVADLGYSFKYAAPVASTLGLSLEELAAATGLMVDRGLTGEQAGTSLRMALMRLSNPPKAARKALEKLNISLTDSQGKFKSLAQITEEWNRATKNLTDTQKVAYAQTIFGTEAATGMLNLFAAGADEIEELTKALEGSTGAAKEAARAMKDNYAGALEELKGSIETAQIKFMAPILPVFKDLFQGLGTTLDENVDLIEKAGERAASALRDIFEPFFVQEPIDPKNVVDWDAYARSMKFANMDFGDKVVYSLDQAADKVEKWLSGTGGESMNKIFTKLGEIAARAWFEAFTGSLESSIKNLGEGNIFSALGMGAVAWMLGGGLLFKGAVGTGRLIKGVVTGRKAKAMSALEVAADVPAAQQKKAVASVPVNRAATGSKLTSVLGKSGKIGGTLSKASGVLGKAVLPLAAAGTVLEIIRSEDKTKATISGTSGLLGTVGGAKIGATIGTAIAPGIGTAVGTALGSIIGWASGKFLGGKAVDAARQSSQPNTAVAQSTMINQTGWEQSFKEIKTSAELVKRNLDLLGNYAGQACGWLASLYYIQSASRRVEEALNNLAQRINNIQVPGSLGIDRRVSYNG